MNISPRLLCQLAAVCMYGDHSVMPDPTEMSDALDAALREDRTLQRNYGWLLRHSPDYQVRHAKI